MKVRSWLSTCSSTKSTAISAASSPPSTATFSDIETPFSSSLSSTWSSNSSIQSKLSILTLPSVPSLQTLIPSPENTAAKPPAAPTFITSIKLGKAHVSFLAIHDNLLYAASGNEIKVYETVNITLFDAFEVKKISGAVKSIVFMDGKVFTAHQDCKIRVWKLGLEKKHELVATLPNLEDRLLRLFFPRNYVRVRRHSKKLWIEHHDTVSGLAAGQNDVVLSVSWDRSFKLWETRSFKCMESIDKAHDDAINAIVVSNDGIVYTGSADKRINVWKKESKKYRLLATLEKHKSAVNALALSFDGSILFSGSCDRSILVWEKEDSANHMSVTGALRGHAKAVLCLVNVRDLLLSGSADRTVRIWQQGFGGSYCCLSVLDGHRSPVRSLAAAVEEGGAKVFSGSFDGEIRVWHVEVASDVHWE